MHHKPKGSFRIVDEAELALISGGDAPGAPGSGLPGQEWDSELGGWVNVDGFGGMQYGGIELWGAGSATELSPGLFDTNGDGQGNLIVVTGNVVNDNGDGTASVNPIDTPSEYACLAGQSLLAAGTLTAGIGGSIFLAGLVTPGIPDGELVGGIVAAVGAVGAGVGQAISIFACPSPSFG